MCLLTYLALARIARTPSSKLSAGELLRHCSDPRDAGVMLVVVVMAGVAPDLP